MSRTSNTIHCSKHTTPQVITSATATSNIEPKYCPQCGHKAMTFPSDGFDTYAIRLHQSRAQTLLFLNKAPRLLEQHMWHMKKNHIERTYMQAKQTPLETLEHEHKPLTNAEWAERIFKNLPQELVHGTCQIRQSCHTCGTSITLLVSSPDNPTNSSIQTMPIAKFCTYCGSSNTTITPVTSHIDPMEHLAQTHNLPLLTTRAYYTVWQTKFNHIPTFAQFLEELPQLSIRVTLPKPTTQKPFPKPTKPTGKFKLVVRHVPPNIPPKSTPDPIQIPDPIAPNITQESISIHEPLTYTKCSICGCELPKRSIKEPWIFKCEPCQQSHAMTLKYFKLELQ